MCVYNGFDVFNHYSNAVTQVCKIKLYFLNIKKNSLFFLKNAWFFQQKSKKTLRIIKKLEWHYY